jgi:HAD superfamily hydrolase (TIGR01490 family)
MVEQIAWHRAAGHELVIVSAGLETYLRPFAAALGFDHVIAVAMEVGESGHLTGAMVGPNVRGPEKAHRLSRWLGDDRPELMWAYGNSNGDRELLAMADVPVWVAGASRAKRDTTARPIGAGGRALSV